MAGAGSIVRLYENGVLKATTTADASGLFTLTWQSALDEHHVVQIYTVACEPGGACSQPSRTITLRPPQSFWCPQRSYWEGDAQGHHFIFYFRDENGLYTSDDFTIPGVSYFSNTLLHLYSCCDSESNPFRVIADGNKYANPISHEGHFFTFNIGYAHNVEIEAKCQVGGGGEEPEVRVTNGKVLIDPDGFVFDSAYGGSYDPQTEMFDPVKPVQGVTVTAYVSVPEWGGWTIWPAHLFNDQVNPQVTGEDGYFAFFTPPGQYYLQASATGGFQSWRSPLIEVITQVVHRNIPLTQFSQGSAAHVTLIPSGLSQAKVNVSPGGVVEWRSALDAAGTANQLAALNDNPVGRLLSTLDPLINPLGFDSGMLIPGSIYQRQFITPGLYTYSDGWGHNGQVVVSEQRLVYLPLTVRRR